MTFTIPIWLIWTLGIIVGLPALIYILLCVYVATSILFSGGFKL